MDNIEQDINRAERRVRRYWLDDGLAEAFSGVVFALVGVYLALLSVGPQTGPWATALVAGFPLLVIGLCTVLRKWILAAKDRFVHPRTGFVQLPRRQTHRWPSGILAGCIAALLALLVNRTPIIVTWIPALLGLVLSGAFLAVGRRTGFARFPMEGILVAVAGFVISLQRLDENLATGAVFGWVGLVMVAGGAIVFFGYLRRHHLPEES
jgi:uncharacterized membrane protein YjjP (DUF1212 family)